MTEPEKSTTTKRWVVFITDDSGPPYPAPPTPPPPPPPPPPKQYYQPSLYEQCLPIIIVSSVFGLIFIIGPLLVWKGPNRSTTRCCIMIASFCMWLFWITIYIAQLNPLIGPRLENTTYVWIMSIYGIELYKLQLLVYLSLSFKFGLTMNCARLNLQERSKKKSKEEPKLSEKPLRYCQKRLVDPQHEEDRRWMDVFDRFHCNVNIYGGFDSARVQQTEDLFLTVQTLKFQGEVDQTTRPRTSFKYVKNPTHTHRLFVKKELSEINYSEDDRSSELTSYFFDDYVKYLFNGDRSRPTSEKSCIFLNAFNSNTIDKTTQIVSTQANKRQKSRKPDTKLKNVAQNGSRNDTKDVFKDVVVEPLPNTRISYQKNGKRKSLTISRAQSPETMQVIRVDVVCNVNSSMSLYDDTSIIDKSTDLDKSKLNGLSAKNNHFTKKYLLTKTVRALDESLLGSKVTLLCKTFKLSDRGTSTSDKPCTINNRSYTKTHKRALKNYNKVKKSVLSRH